MFIYLRKNVSCEEEACAPLSGRGHVAQLKTIRIQTQRN